MDDKMDDKTAAVEIAEAVEDVLQKLWPRLPASGNSEKLLEIAWQIVSQAMAGERLKKPAENKA